ncbi:MAG: 16S rRNA (guanine(966)-N(2))-methyltransferase RsmD [SAR202 cluster bacterium]|nr:16S rRNA (guanine(966)-N(2))-methyltransferase RsmD [SAR202 cluster bacterium]
MTTKITGGHLRGRTLRTRRNIGLRPTAERVRSAIFSIVGADKINGSKVLDLFAGTGAMGIEALSRGASWADFIESDGLRCRQLREVTRELGLNDVTRVFKKNAIQALEIITGSYDLVFIDPPYQSNPWENLMSRLGNTLSLNVDSLVIAEHRYDRELLQTYGRLTRAENRRYGDTSISIYINGVQNG